MFHSLTLLQHIRAKKIWIVTAKNIISTTTSTIKMVSKIDNNKSKNWYNSIYSIRSSRKLQQQHQHQQQQFNNNQQSRNYHSNTIKSLGNNNNNNNNLSNPIVVKNNIQLGTTIYGTIPLNGNGITIGQYACMERTFTIDDVSNFIKLSGDDNPLHTSWTSSTNTNENIPTIVKDHLLFQWETNDKKHDETNDNDADTGGTILGRSKVVVHGMLVSSMFTCIFGTLIPGAVYMKQNIDFKKPVYVNDTVVATITINRIRSFQRTKNNNNNNTSSHNSGLIVSCSTIISSPSPSPTTQRTTTSSTDKGCHDSTVNDNTNDTTTVIEYVKGEAIVWMTQGVEL